MKDDFKMDIKEQGMSVRTGFIWLMIGTSGDSCEHTNEPSNSIKDGEFLD
jgi:hypothetical protein